jgi:hypothetical protein
MSRLVRTTGYGLLLVLAAGVSAFSPVQARVQFDIIAKFRNAELQLDLVTIFDSEVDASKSKIALLGIATPVRTSFSFGRAGWLSLMELWTKAMKAQSDSWKVVGSMTETETSTISAGPGVKFVIRSFQRGTVIFVLSR